MAKGTKLPEFEKGEITTLKRIRKSLREILKVLGCSKTVICNYLKSPNKYQTRKSDQKNYHHNSWEEKNFVNIKNIEISSGCSLQY